MSIPAGPSARVLLDPPGQIAFLEMLDRMGSETGAALLCVVLDLGDLHRSDRVARTLGPAYANGLAASAAARIRDAIGPDVPVYRVDVDCFALALPDDGGTGWETLIGHVVKTLQEPLDCAGLPGAVAPSAGLARFAPGEADARRVLRNAMAAAQDARTAEASWRFHESEGGGGYERLHAVLAGLAPALAGSDQLSLAYQPRIDLQSGACLSAEALLRWKHPVLGNVPPGEFIPLAEQTGMVRFVTEWVLERAVHDLSLWSEAGFQHGVSINISAINLAEDEFAGRLRDLLDRSRIDPARVELELTEGALVRDNTLMRGTIAELAAIGVGMSIDDFGTGYSNLFYLRDLPATALKIDQSFIRWLASNDRDPIIVSSMISLAHDLGYRVVAEGIEDDGAMAMLAGWGCDEGQGYLISRPVPLTAMQTWLSNRPDLPPV